MRKEFWLLLIVNGSIVLFLLYQVFDLITLLNDDSFEDTFKESELLPVEYKEVTTTLANGTETTTLVPDRPLLIPKIIHQTYKTEAIPEKWQKTHQSVIDLHPDYKYILWTDKMAREFIELHYSWFLPTFDSYPYNIMRADSIRYFVLSYYGGVYIDLDNGCTHNMDPLLAAPAWMRKTDPTGVSNDLMGSIPGHPYFAKVIKNLERYNHNWFISYVTIMYSTGPLMLSVLWKQYKRWGVPAESKVRLLLPTNGTTHQSYFFYQGRNLGSSWHQDDAKLIIQMGKHWFLVTILITAVVLLFFYGQYKLYQKVSFTTLNKYRRWAVRYVVINLPGGKRRGAGGHSYGRTRSRSSSPLVGEDRLSGNGDTRSWSPSDESGAGDFDDDDMILGALDGKDSAAVHITDYEEDRYNGPNGVDGQLLARPRSRNDDLV